MCLIFYLVFGIRICKYTYMLVISLNINIVNNHQLHNQILLNNVAEVDGKCKWSQLQRVFLNVMRAFEFKYGSGKNQSYEETSGIPQ